MQFNPFQLAAQKAKRIVGDEKWNSLGFAEQSAAIYRELRLIDAELARSHSFSEELPSRWRSAAPPSASPRATPEPKARRGIDREAA